MELPGTNHESNVEEKPRAVDGVSFTVKKGECFALLGLSGAGKSSTFNMLLGQESISGGQAYLDNLSLENMYNEPEKMHKLVGYCPQTNSIEDFLTVQKSLYYIAELVGVKVDKIERTVEEYIRRFDLLEFKNTRAGALSGGNKRKLCCAQAMLGTPKVMFIDEVSAGVDPVARRTVWKGMHFEANESALLLTTHTMEEAEALATKIGIMASGKLKCMGTL